MQATTQVCKHMLLSETSRDGLPTTTATVVPVQNASAAALPPIAPSNNRECVIVVVKVIIKYAP